MKTKLFIIILYLIFLVSCGTTVQIKQESVSQEKKFVKENKSEKKLYKGEGLVIAITVPQSRNLSNEKAWIPLYMQDSLTGNFAHYTKMTVLDRSNENLIKAEQELSETGFYSEENSIQIGQMTNASMVVVGSIQQIGDLYEINFRINDITTNEIKSSTNERYAYSDIENGTAVNTIVQNLLQGLEIQLSEKEKTELSKVNKNEDNSMQNLAKGITAEKSKDYITAIAAYSLVDGKAKTEAQSNIHSLLAGSFDSASIQSRVAYYKEQIEKWNTIFFQLEKYMNDNFAYIIYDFSDVQDEIDMKNKELNLRYAPGIKCIPNKAAMEVYANVLNEWKAIWDNEENDAWKKEVKLPYFGQYQNYPHIPYNLDYNYIIEFVVTNGENEVIGNDIWRIEINCSDYYLDTRPNYLNGITLKSQKQYASDYYYPFSPKYIKGIKLDDVTGDINIKINNAYTAVFDLRMENGKRERKKIYKQPAGIFSIDEWNEFINNY